MRGYEPRIISERKTEGFTRYPPEQDEKMVVAEAVRRQDFLPPGSTAKLRRKDPKGQYWSECPARGESEGSMRSDSEWEPLAAIWLLRIWATSTSPRRKGGSVELTAYFHLCQVLSGRKLHG